MDARTLHKELLGMQRELTRSKTEYIAAARRMLYLCKAVDLALESLYEGPAVERAVWRYEAIWLPLVAAVVGGQSRGTGVNWSVESFGRRVDEIRGKNFAPGGLWLKREDLVPPLDIAWIWHVHRLDPVGYASDVARLVDGADDGRVAEWMSTNMDTAFLFSDGEDTQSKPLRRLWDVVYPFEAFVPRYLLSCTYEQDESRKRQSITTYSHEMGRAGWRPVFEYPLARAAKIQQSFLYQVVDEHDPEKEELYESNNYLNRAYDRYLLFLALHKRAPDTLLVPMVDINIMWHMHLSCTTEYARDCEVLVGYTIKHDSLAVKDAHALDMARIDSGEPDADDKHSVVSLQSSALAEMEEDEIEDILERRSRGIAVKDTKTLWESCYGAKPRYDLPDTRYRGQPKGDRGGFRLVFERTNGTTKDISWHETLARMVFAVLVMIAGLLGALWAFYLTMVTHGKFLAGIPGGLAVTGLGLYIFLAIPISRPLSSDSRFWLDRSFKQTHNPLPPYLISSTNKKSV